MPITFSRWQLVLLAMNVAYLSAGSAFAENDSKSESKLAKSLTLHASFDKGLDADFSRGDKTCYDLQGKDVTKATLTPEVQLDPAGGRFGGALHFTKKNKYRPAFKNAGVLDYNAKDWNASVSVWLRLDPDKDLEPGYCDPRQIVGSDGNKGFIFLEWSKDGPRMFRYAIRPLTHIWNPNKLPWDGIPADKRPMVQIKQAPFSHDDWTHIVFTLDHINNKQQSPSGTLYMNGERKGSIDNWDLTFDWHPSSVMLVLGAAYVGRMDDLAVFDRPLSADDVKQLYGLKQGARELY